MIDTKKAREMRAKGTAGKWESDGDRVTAEEGTVADCWMDPDEENAELIAYAVNALAPMANEIDRMRVALNGFRELGKEVLGAYEGRFPGQRDLRQLIDQADTLLGDSK